MLSQPLPHAVNAGKEPWATNPIECEYFQPENVRDRVKICSFAAVGEKLLTGTSGTDKREGESRGNRRCTRGNGGGGGGVGGSGKISIESDLCLENINYSVLCWEPREREEEEYSSGVPRTLPSATKKTSLRSPHNLTNNNNLYKITSTLYF
jgi:hypothetical protein